MPTAQMFATLTKFATVPFVTVVCCGQLCRVDSSLACSLLHLGWLAFKVLLLHLWLAILVWFCHDARFFVSAIALFLFRK